MLEGPWLFNGRLIILKPWSEHIGLERDLFSSVPVSVHFPALHLKLWSKRVRSKATSIIGKPLYTDKATASGGRLVFARCFIEITATLVLSRSVKLDVGNGEVIEVPVEFKWVPPRCLKCKSFGHLESHYPTVEVWKPKKPANPNSDSATNSNTGEANASGNGEVFDNNTEVVTEEHWTLMMFHLRILPLIMNLHKVIELKHKIIISLWKILKLQILVCTTKLLVIS